MDRRQALELLGKGLCGAVAMHGLAGCATPEETTTRVRLDAIPDGGRLEVGHLGTPVELSRDGSAVQARSLLCTHVGCRVRWQEAQGGAAGEYQCACHGGRFDAAGRPIAGPPDLPLRAVPVSVAGDLVTMGEA